MKIRQVTVGTVKPIGVAGNGEMTVKVNLFLDLSDAGNDFSHEERKVAKAFVSGKFSKEELGKSSEQAPLEDPGGKGPDSEGTSEKKQSHPDHV